MWRRLTGFLSCGIGLFASMPAHAEFSPQTELVRCGKNDCLRITGHRENVDHVVSLNGVAVAAQGRNDWHVDLPVNTVRKICAPGSQAIEVAMRDPETRRAHSASARLPIGLLVDSSKLAAIEVTAF